MNAIASETSPPPQCLVPPMPESLEEAGLTPTGIEQHLLKMIYFRGESMGRDLATALGLRFSLIEPLLEGLKRTQAVQVKRSLGIGSMSSCFSLSESGRTYAKEYLEGNQYTGPAPVPLYQYTYLVRRQRQQEGWLTKESLERAYR